MIRIEFVGCPWWLLAGIDGFFIIWGLYFLVEIFETLRNWKLRRRLMEAEAHLAASQLETARLEEMLTRLRTDSGKIQTGWNA